MAASTLTSLCRRLRNLCTNLDMVLRFAVHTLVDIVSIRHAQNDVGCKGIWERHWLVVWTEYRCGVIKCVDVAIVAACICMLTFLSDCWCKRQNFPDASLDILVALDGQIFQTNVYSASHPPTQSPRPGKLSR